MKLSYLGQFPMVSHHSDFVSNTFYKFLTPMVSCFIFAFTSITNFVAVANIVPFLIDIISQAFSHRSLSFLGHLERVFDHLSICDNHFHGHFIFDIIIIPLMFTTDICTFSIIIVYLLHVTFTISLPPYHTSVSLIGKSGGWFAVTDAESYWPSIEGFSSTINACCRAIRMIGVGLDMDRLVTGDSHNSSWDGMMSFIICCVCKLSS